jgi:hypothetical protein
LGIWEFGDVTKDALSINEEENGFLTDCEKSFAPQVKQTWLISAAMRHEKPAEGRTSLSRCSSAFFASSAVKRVQ